MSEFKNETIEFARKHVALVVETLKLDDAARDRLSWKHEAAVRSTETGIAYADADGNIQAGLDTAGWLRTIERDEPNLMNKQGASQPKVAPSDLRSASMTSLFIASRQGSTDASAELERRTRSGFHETSKKSKDDRLHSSENMTELWAKAAKGDKDALNKLNKQYLI